jgi:hypothetical protein
MNCAVIAGPFIFDQTSLHIASRPSLTASMSSGAAAFSKTLSGGIQDISAVLSLFGTEQCERHVGSALRGGERGGFLYAAITPISIFGSLGVAKSAFSIVIGTIPRFGAKRLQHIGIDPAGDAVQMIMLQDKRYVTEVCFLQLLQKHFIRDVRQFRINFTPPVPPHFYKSWNLQLIFFSVVVAAAGVTPYVRISARHDTSYLSLAILFPLCRVMGGLFCVLAGQILLQRRIAMIMRQRLLFWLINDPLKQGSTEVKVPTQFIRDWGESIASERCLHSLNKFLHTEEAETGGHEKFIRYLLPALEIAERSCGDPEQNTVSVCSLLSSS